MFYKYINYEIKSNTIMFFTGLDIIKNIGKIDLDLLNLFYKSKSIHINFYIHNLNEIEHPINLSGLEMFDKNKVENISIVDSHIRDITLLQEFKKLKHITLYNNPKITSIEPLMNLKHISYLDIIDCNIKEIEILKFKELHPDCEFHY